MKVKFNMKAMLSALFALQVSACVDSRDSIFSDELLSSKRDWNNVNLARIQNVEADGRIRIAIFTDSHQNYVDLRKVVKQINATPDVDFVVSLGDITNFGYGVEYDQFFRASGDLRRPLLTVIGNHDALGAGPEIFAKAFGPSNYYFETPSVRFVFWHSVELEDSSGFEPEWLFDVVNGTTKRVIIFSHVPLDDKERFQGEFGIRLWNVVTAPHVFAVFNGHNHEFTASQPAGTFKIQVPRVEGVRWFLFDVPLSDLSIAPAGQP